jgi:hypothetical protein
MIVPHNNQLNSGKPEFPTLLPWFIGNIRRHSYLLTSFNRKVGKSAQNSAHWLHLQIHPFSVAAIVFLTEKIAVHRRVSTYIEG